MSTNLTRTAVGSPNCDSFINSKRPRERTSICYQTELCMDSEGGGGGREISSEVGGGQHRSSEWLYSQHLSHDGIGH